MWDGGMGPTREVSACQVKIAPGHEREAHAVHLNLHHSISAHTTHGLYYHCTITVLSLYYRNCARHVRHRRGAWAVIATYGTVVELQCSSCSSPYSVHHLQYGGKTLLCSTVMSDEYLRQRNRGLDAARGD